MSWQSRSRRSTKNASKSSARSACDETRWLSRRPSSFDAGICALDSTAARYFEGALPPIVRFVFAEIAVLLTMLSRRSSSMPFEAHQCLGKMWWMSTLRLVYWTLSSAWREAANRSPCKRRRCAS